MSIVNNSLSMPWPDGSIDESEAIVEESSFPWDAFSIAPLLGKGI